ncbi:hypothetical protein SVIOM74S_06409 [Streptomyces violarus]
MAGRRLRADNRMPAMTRRVVHARVEPSAAPRCRPRHRLPRAPRCAGWSDSTMPRTSNRVVHARVEVPPGSRASCAAELRTVGGVFVRVSSLGMRPIIES